MEKQSIAAAKALLHELQRAIPTSFSRPQLSITA